MKRTMAWIWVGAIVSATLVSGCLGDLHVSSTGSGGSGGSGGSSAGGAAGEGGMMFCVPGSTTQCNTGMPGSCAAGQAKCDSVGKLYGPCEIVVSPSFDDCRTADDEDCDGNAISQCTGAIDRTVTRIGAKDAPADDVIFGLTMLPAGGFAVTGFVDGDLGNNSVVNAGKMFVAKYNDDGVQQWERAYPTTAFAAGRAIAADAAGNIVVVGEFKGNGTIGGINLTSSSGSRDVFIARFDPMGQVAWAKVFGATVDDVATSVAIDDAGNIIFSGTVRGGKVDFGGNAVDASADDAFVTKFSPTGAHLWSNIFVNGGDQNGRNVALTKSGDVILAGESKANFSLGGMMHSVVDGVDAFLARFSGKDGTYQWSGSYSGIGDQFTRGLAVSANDEVFLVGRFTSVISFGNQSHMAIGTTSGFLAQFDSASGNYVKSTSFGSGEIYPQGVSVDRAGHVLMVGAFNGQVGLGSAATISSTDMLDSYLIKLEAKTWNQLWIDQGSNIDQQFYTGLGSDALGRVFVGGSFKVELLGPTPANTLKTTGGFDLFVRRFAP